jgi:ABC-type ATPase involved in cell division
MGARLEGKVCVITGTGGSIGSALLTCLFARERASSGATSIKPHSIVHLWLPLLRFVLGSIGPECSLTLQADRRRAEWGANPSTVRS